MQKAPNAVALALCILGGSLSSARAAAPAGTVQSTYDKEQSSLIDLYKHLHQNPELSFHEKETAARMAAEVTRLGFEVKTNIGGHGVAALLRNGDGPTVMLRTDLDALPVKEETGVPHASQTTTVDDEGKTVSVMHACGHDLHMTAWVGTARMLAAHRDLWKGTLMMIAQPAEEKGGGARAMLAAGLFKKIKRPDYALALHTNAELASGTVGYTSGYALANVDTVDITVRGKGGHGAYPHKTIDPVVTAARIVVTLQTIVAREIDPLESAVVTVGSIHGGTKHNIIPDEVKLQLTVRSYKPEVRLAVLAAIKRVAIFEAKASGAPAPEIVVSDKDYTKATFNDPNLSQRVAASMSKILGDKNVLELPAVMGGEDFGEYATAGVPAVIYWLGAVEPRALDRAAKTHQVLPSLHSPLFAPHVGPALRTGVLTLTQAAMDLLSGQR